MFSKKVGIVVGVFGLLIVAGVFIDAFNRHSPDVILPGVAIGTVWAAVGFKQGLPIIPASAASDVRGGLRIIRRRLFLVVLAVCAWFPAAAIILPRVSPNARTTAFFVVALPPLLAFVWWTLSACPRCREYFFPVGQFWLRFSLSRCQHCGLQMKQRTQSGG
jgi:hypothetical protein